MDKQDFYSPKYPWLYLVEASVSDITNFAWSLTHNNQLRVVVRFLRGRKMLRLGCLFDEFAAALQFPYYFGENWSAFDECITDLEWLPGDAYILVIIDSEAVLSKEDKEQFSTLISVLQKAGDEWSQPIENSEAWDRPAAAFHVIFQCSEFTLRCMISRFEDAGAAFQVLRLEEIQ